MYSAIVYLKGFFKIKGVSTNNFDLEFNNFWEIDDILDNYGISADDINVIDFRFKF